MKILPLRVFLGIGLLALIVNFGSTGILWSQKPPVPLVPNPLAPVLKSPVPMGMQRGTTLDLTLTGTNLNEPTGVWTSFPATVTIPTDNKNGTEATKLRVRVQVPADAPIGFQALRLSTRRGMSNLRMFCIDDLPQVLRSPTAGRSRATPQELTVPCVVVGKIDAEATDWYKIKVQANQRLSFDVLGRRLGSAVDPQLTLWDAKTGHDLPGGHSNDAPGLQTDPCLTYTFKEAGDVLIELRDVAYRGGEDFHYRLRIGDFPCATTPLPMAVKRGSKVNVAFAGPSGNLAVPVPVQAPTDPTVSTIWVTPRGANGLSGWPVSLELSDIDEVQEQEPNNEPAKANRLTVPVGVTGRFQEKGDVDHYVFAAKKGQRLTIDAQTTDLHSPAEVYLVLRDAKAAQLQASNPMAAARLDFTPSANGDYYLSVEHLHLWGGPAETYHLTITPHAPGFDLTVALDRFDIAQAGKLSLPIQVVRRDYTGPIEVTVVGKGLTGQATIAMGQAAGTLPITAALEMPMGPHTFLIQGKANINGKMVSEYASIRTPLSQSLANLPVPPRPWYHQFALAVTERPPFDLAAKFDSPMATPGKPAPLTITATRLPAFTGEIALTAAGLPGNVTAMLKNIPAGQKEVKVELKLAANAPVGTFNVTLTGKAKHNNHDYIVNTTVPLVIKK